MPATYETYYVVYRVNPDGRRQRIDGSPNHRYACLIAKKLEQLGYRAEIDKTRLRRL